MEDKFPIGSWVRVSHKFLCFYFPNRSGRRRQVVGYEGKHVRVKNGWSVENHLPRALSIAKRSPLGLI